MLRRGSQNTEDFGDITRAQTGRGLKWVEGTAGRPGNPERSKEGAVGVFFLSGHAPLNVIFDMCC